MRFCLPALVAIAVLPVAAHHPFTACCDASKLASISGPIVERRTIHPHVKALVGSVPLARWPVSGCFSAS